MPLPPVPRGRWPIWAWIALATGTVIIAILVGGIL
jgi:hypothetical protein